MNHSFETLGRQYILRPLRLIFAGGTILMVALGLFALDQIGDFSPPRIETTGTWLFEQLPSLIIRMSSSKVILAVLIAAYVSKSLVLYLLTFDLSQIFQRTRRSLFDTILRRFPRQGFAWFLVSEFCIYLSFLGSPQEFVKPSILRGFSHLLKSDIFGIGHGHALGLQ